ncbi:MAG: hypothetical protein HeimC3_39230 [Candidatus Heimdallarchaeota archaeon LC_3]|nr:MAG: hypothetical protein HeimC3_39230 [Candidatus Heimdallarchaeota archaeon LC_3]
MGNNEHRRKLIQGREEWNIWRKNNPGLKIDLKNLSLINYNFVGFAID